MYEIIFESDTPAGRLFDTILLVLIVASVTLICVESYEPYRKAHAAGLRRLDLFFTFIFTLEYFARLYAAPRPMSYIKSSYGIIDLASILPTYLGTIFPAMRFLMAIRILRLLRVFRIFQLSRYMQDSVAIVDAIWNARRKIFVFFAAVFLITVVAGAAMYVIESPYNDGFNNIPQSVYWAIVTLTTVGYGDISPVTPLGKAIASLIMLLGYCIIAVPTGIMSASMVRTLSKHDENSQRCPGCFRQGHDVNAKYCKYCGNHL